MQKIIAILFVLATVAGTVNAAEWNAAGTDPDYWDIAANWNPVGVPTAADDAQFTDASEAECIIRTAAACKKFAVGDNGPTTFTRKVRIVDGGHLVSGGGVWGTSGYNRDSMVTVDEGGILESTTRFGIGLVGGPVDTPQTSYLNINGGEMSVDGDLQIGAVGNGSTTSDHTGIVNVYLGTLHVTGGLAFRDPSVGFIDIKYGTLTVDGDITVLVADMVDNVPANITGFGGEGTLEAVFANGVTTITATHPMDPSPIFTTVPVGDVNLSWTNLGPSTPVESVWVDVWFGTDPNKLNPLYSKDGRSGIEVVGGAVSTATVSAPANGTYYWQVDSYIANPDLINDANMIEGDVWSFDASDDAPPTNVYAGVNMMTWANQSVDLLGTYEDDGASPVKETWSSSDPNAVFSPSDDGGITGNAAEATVTVDNAAGAVTLTFTVKDGLNPADSDDMVVTVYEDACEAARTGDGRAADYPGDFNADCIVDLIDLAEEIAAKWMDDYALKDPVAKP